ncbi:membrane protein [Streptomyces phage Gilgamesh]|uniref:Membrane protein n=1 Tax=Streptomyces phage Gilgamesh TaxID=2599890 RepID=A0A5J6TXT4_9CAUD|nr:membrane protein [Streptomyces phage Gilgamesh]QFG13292.1 membrane protein [Streptomyces phage Gilgamesh]
MPTDDIIDMCTTIPLWLVVAVRAYQRPTSPGKRAILATFTALAVGATLRLSYLEDFLIGLTGMKDFAVLPKHLAVMVACTLLVGWVESVVPPRPREPAWRRWVALKPRLAVLTVASIAASLAFPFSAPSVLAPDGSRDFASPQYGDVAGTTHLALYLLSMGAALVPSALLCLTVARRTDDRLLRLCMRLMAAGAGAGVLYPVYRLSFLVCGFTDWTFPLSEAQFHRGGSLIQLVTILLVIAGSSVRAAELLVRAVRLRRGLVALRPLWEELVSVLPPDVIRRRLSTTPSAREERRRLRDLYGRLDERVVDISDACFELLPWVSEDLHRQALTEARGAGLHGYDARAAREALCLRVARVKAVESEPYTTRPAGTVLSLRNDLQSNAAWLARVAHHYASPDLTDAANRLAGHHVLQEVTA